MICKEFVCCLDVISEMALCFSSFFLGGVLIFLFLDFFLFFVLVCSTTEALVLYASNYEIYK